MRVDKAMRTENLRMVTAMRTTIALIFCVHDLSHTHTENQSNGCVHGCDQFSVRMALSTRTENQG